MTHEVARQFNHIVTVTREFRQPTEDEIDCGVATSIDMEYGEACELARLIRDEYDALGERVWVWVGHKGRGYSLSPLQYQWMYPCLLGPAGWKDPIKAEQEAYYEKVLAARRERDKEAVLKAKQGGVKKRKRAKGDSIVDQSL